MNLRELSRWQWRDYARYHANRSNLLLHVLTVPVFWAGSLLLVFAVWRWNWSALAAGLACLLTSLAAQGRGHRLEAVPPAPFTGAGNFIARLLLEQWVNFPRFVLSGRWRRPAGGL